MPQRPRPHFVSIFAAAALVAGMVSATVANAVDRPDIDAVLPNFDVRAQRSALGALTDGDLNSTGARATAIAALEQTFAPGDPDTLMVEVNDLGLPKMLFRADAPLTAPSDSAPDDVARTFLSAHSNLFGLSAASVDELQLDNVDVDRGITFLNYTQRINGVRVFEGVVQAAVDEQGAIVNVNEGELVTKAPVDSAPGLTEHEGLVKAFEFVGHPETTPASIVEREDASATANFENPLGESDLASDLRWLRVGDETRLAWHSLIDVGPNEWYEILVDADTGELLFRMNLYADAAQGTVFKRDPSRPPRTVESFVGPATINPNGWMGAATVTNGNNVDAYLDRDSNNAPDNDNTAGMSGGRASSATQNFTFAFDPAVDPRTEKPASVTSLFYFNNIAHDFAYNLGFTESAGNFQVNNLGRGGTGNDAVKAEAQDGSGTNNANFATPPEGQSPRMQQFLFTVTTPNRDSSFDGDVVLHEYGHGISNRLVGGPANVSCLNGTQSGAMGEGWSDYWAVTFYNDGAMGEYVVNDPKGIRRAAYTVPAAAVHDSYADVGVGGFEVHSDGEVWAATLNDLRVSLGSALSDQLVMSGMKFTPCRPSMLNARDGILQADTNMNAGANNCAIWTVFARHGMGFSAVGNDGTTHTAATNLPTTCSARPTIGVSPTSLSLRVRAGANTVTRSVSITNTGSGPLNWSATSNAPWLTISPATGTAPSTLTVTVKTAGLPVGTRTGAVTLTGTNATNSPLALSVSLTVTPVTVNAARFTEPVAPGGLASTFGSGLATGTASGTDIDPVTPGIQLPTSLLGTTVDVVDGQGANRSAPLLFVSPGQLNFQIPAGTAPGPVTIGIRAGDGTISSGETVVAAVAPGLFSASGNGQGLATGQLLRRNASGDTNESVDGITFRNGDQLFLVLYGTGIRSNTSATATAGGVSVPVLFAGNQGTFVGLDQINLGPLPASLAGRGLVDVVITANGVAANAVQVRFA